MEASEFEMTRPDYCTYFMRFANLAAERSTCLRRKVGAVIVKNNMVVATGYNGAPSGCRHCCDVGCLRESMRIKSGERHELCRGVHAEQNAIIQAAVHGVSVDGSTLYCTTQPCSVCVKMIINAKIRRVVYGSVYNDPLALELASEVGLKMFQAREEDRNG